MDSVTVRELRNHGGEVLDRVARGEALLVTRDGDEVAELRPIRRPTRRTAELISKRRTLPKIDAQRLRDDVADLIDDNL